MAHHHAKSIIKTKDGRNWYEVIGVARTSDAATVRKAYLRAILKAHPDRNGGDDTRAKELGGAKKDHGHKGKQYAVGAVLGAEAIGAAVTCPARIVAYTDVHTIECSWRHFERIECELSALPAAQAANGGNGSAAPWAARLSKRFVARHRDRTANTRSHAPTGADGRGSGGTR